MNEVFKHKNDSLFTLIYITVESRELDRLVSLL